MAEINVVPYIDVMLVLLVIFMITAPLLTEGVKVDLPQADSRILEQDDREPVVVTIDLAGNLYMDIGGEQGKPVSREDLLLWTQAILRNNPQAPPAFLVRGDRQIDYGRVIEAMVLLQQAGVEKVGLITEPPNS